MTHLKKRSLIKKHKKKSTIKNRHYKKTQNKKNSNKKQKGKRKTKKVKKARKVYKRGGRREENIEQPKNDNEIRSLMEDAINKDPPVESKDMIEFGILRDHPYLDEEGNAPHYLRAAAHAYLFLDEELNETPESYYSEHGGLLNPGRNIVQSKNQLKQILSNNEMSPIEKTIKMSHIIKEDFTLPNLRDMGL